MIDQVAGAGDYIVHLRVQRGGAGSTYVMLPKTTGTAASGETAIAFQTIPIAVSTGDVVSVYVDGLAGDTTTPDVITDWYELDPVRPATADRTVAVDASGRVDVSLIEGTDATDALAAAAEAALASTDTSVGAIAADVTTLLSRLTAARAGYLDVLAGWTGTLRQALRAMATKAAGESSSDLTGGSSTYVNTTDSLENIKDSVSAGSASAADIAAELAAAGYTVVDTDSVSSSSISKRRGDLWAIALADLGALGTWTKLWLTIKSGYSDPDSAAVVQILLTNPGAGGDGLQRLNGAVATAAQGSIVVDDSATGDLTITVAAVATAQLSPGQLYFDVQILRAAGTTTLAEGTWTVRPDATRATS